MLPLVEQRAAEPEPESEDPIEGGTETILLVEDEPAVAKLAESLLSRLGYRVIAATSPHEALAAAAAQDAAIDLVLTDVVMPGASGAELIAQLLAVRPGVRALYMSGYPPDAVVRRGVPDGVQGGDVPFLQKPFTLATLARKVREALR